MSEYTMVMDGKCYLCKNNITTIIVKGIKQLVCKPCHKQFVKLPSKDLIITTNWIEDKIEQPKQI